MANATHGRCHPATLKLRPSPSQQIPWNLAALTFGCLLAFTCSERKATMESDFVVTYVNRKIAQGRFLR